MKKLTLFSAVMLLLSITSFAQSANPCGFDDLHQEMLRTDHKYETKVREINNRWVKYSKMMSTALLTYTSKGYVYEIPMVVHVIHTGEAVSSTALYNIDSTKIGQMIDYMNKNYAAEFPFPDTTTGASGGGCRIPLKFVLAKRTPTGIATNGIVRINGSSTYGSTYTSFGVRRSSGSGITTAQAMALSRWLPSDYYNVYVVNKIDGNDLYSTGGIAGFAYLPYFPTVDGMVVVASQVRSGSTTVAHEFGHAFNLLHTFEGDGGTATCPPNADCTTDGDMVCDTEPAYGSNHWPGWCPPTDINPCTGISYKGVKYNVMDYTNCDYSYTGSVYGPDRFTAGQRARVLNIIDNERVALKTSMGLVTPSGLTVFPCMPIYSGTSASIGPVSVSFNGNVVYTGDIGDEGTAYLDHTYTQQSYVNGGSAYPITVTTDVQRQKVKVFIDYNNDGDFADLGEEVFSNVGATSGPVTHTGSITIPTTATTCTWLRMRVVAALNTAPITDMACGTYSNNAQAEDYGVFVRGASGADTVAIAQTAGTNPSCTGSSVTFTATPETGTPTFRWFVNGNPTAVVTSNFTTSSLADNDVITCRIYYTSACGPDSFESKPIVLRVSSTALAVAKNTLKTGTNPGCAGQSLVFKVNVSGGGSAPIYSWRVNGSVVGFNVDTFATSSLAAGDRVWCYVTPNSTCSTTPVNSDTITIAFSTVVPAASIAVTSGAIPSCDSTSITFTATSVNGGASPKYQWYRNNVIVPGATLAAYTETYLYTGDSVWCRVISNHPCIVPGTGDTSWSNKIYITRTARTVPTLVVVLSKGSNPGCLDSLLEYTATATEAGGSPLVVWYINGAVAAYGNVFGSYSFTDGDTLTCKMFTSMGSCNTVDSLMWGPVVFDRKATPGSPIISLIGTMLVSSVSSGIQWYGPDGIIPGATGSTYHPTKQGNYYAVIVNGGCSGLPSNILNVSLLGISPYNMNEVKIYPNPTSGMLTLDWGSEMVNADVDVFTLTGQKVLHTLIENQNKQTLDLNQLANGNYFVVVRDAKGKTGTVSVTVKH